MKSNIKIFFQPAFLICVVVLAAAGLTKTATMKWFDVQLKKEFLAPRKSVEVLEESLFEPYKVSQKYIIQNQDIVESLGTEEYLQWELEDSEADENSPVRYCMLFVTYYGLPDRVPHVPEECYVGSGSQQLARETIGIKINEAGVNEADERVINSRYLVFMQKGSNVWMPSRKSSVFYVFNVNGEYANGRTEVRNILGRNLFGKYSFFSKVEWRFYGKGFGGTLVPGKEETVKASEKLLSVVLPALEGEYWPDFEAANKKD